MAIKLYDIIYSLVRKRLAVFNTKASGSGITRIPTDRQIKKSMEDVFQTLRDGGYNPVSAEKVIQNEDDLARVLTEIQQKKIAQTEAMKKADEGITRVFDKMRRGIPLNPDDQAALQGSGFKTALDNFKGFEPKVIQGGKDLTMKTPGGEIPYIEHPTQTIIQGGKEVPVKIPKGIKDDVKEASDDVSSGYAKGDTKYNADVLALNLAERRGFIKEGQDATDMAQKEYSKLYSEAYDYLTKLNFLNRPPRKPKKAGGGLIKAMAKLKKKYGKDIIQKGKAPKDKGGRKKLRQMFKDFEERTKKEGGGLAYMLGEPRENFADGGMSRRTFLKIMAALAAFPVVGKLAKTTKVAKGVKPIVTPTAEMPAHFPKLVEKIIKEGQVVKKDFVKKTGDVTTYRHPDRPDMELTIEGEGNRIQLDFETDQGMKAGYEFRKGEIIDDPASSMRGKRGPNEFTQGEVKYKGDSEGNYYKDFEEGIDTGTENLDEFAGVGKQETSKSKVNLDAYDDLAVPDEDLADGGLAGLLGE